MRARGSAFLRPSSPVGGLMSLPKSFKNFAEFEREVLASERRIGLSLEEMVEDNAFDADVEQESDDPFSEMRDF
jgi:hypothetical protein